MYTHLDKKVYKLVRCVLKQTNRVNESIIFFFQLIFRNENFIQKKREKLIKKNNQHKTEYHSINTTDADSDRLTVPSAFE